ncbi:uncharacterized protein LOC130783809 [Actinidia eriantha]|uniref:uncharacterized protein LOC130783809 n=1 Tax=Actinidia eriantha TaxID=165200 RepID=UPI00258C5842|nr:uncharacterized protein LOC130783809 [Actinidia eriantha]
MDENEKQKLQTTSKSYKYLELLKKASQFLVLVSVLSFLLYYSSGISHFFHYYYYNFHFSKWVFPLLNRTPARKYIFLICHGIVVFIAKSSSFTSSPNSHFTDEFAKADEDGVKTAVAEMESRVENKEEIVERVIESLENVHEEEEGNGSSNIHIQEPESSVLVMGAEEEEEYEEREASGLVEVITGTEDDHEEKREEESGSLIPPPAEDKENEVNVTTEELNRKIDEFIRRMKEEIRIGAQQQLIAV